MISCGLDFGTSNSALALSDGRSVTLARLEGENVTIPSAIFFNFEKKHTVFGREALGEYLGGSSGRFMRALKSILGSQLIEETTQVGTERLDFRDIIGLFVGQLKQRAEQESGKPLESVVMGRPVFFVDGDKAADHRAQNELEAIAKAQGFKHVSFEYEPLAAARDYESRINKEELVLVVDIGGGTSDFSVIRLSPEARGKADRSGDILGNSGIHIAGTDFDRNFSMASVMPQMGLHTKLLHRGLEMPTWCFHTMATWHLINTLYTIKNQDAFRALYSESARKDLFERYIEVIDHQRGHEVASKVEDAKIALTLETKTRIDMDFIEEDWMVDVTAPQLEAAIHLQITRIMAVAMETVMQHAKVNPAHISTVFMTGGSTALPGFAASVRELFPQAALVQGDRFSSVAAGLGLCASQRY